MYEIYKHLLVSNHPFGWKCEYKITLSMILRNSSNTVLHPIIHNSFQSNSQIFNCTSYCEDESLSLYSAVQYLSLLIIILDHDGLNTFIKTFIWIIFGIIYCCWFAQGNFLVACFVEKRRMIGHFSGKCSAVVGSRDCAPHSFFPFTFVQKITEGVAELWN